MKHVTTPLCKNHVIFPLTDAIFFFFLHCARKGGEIDENEVRLPRRAYRKFGAYGWRRRGDYLRHEPK
jgi:hypothetical protein